MNISTPQTKGRGAGRLDPALLAVLANRVDTIVREMTNTLLRAGRSAVINVARDFSCSIVTADDRLLASAEGLPVHIFGSHLQTAEMRRRHPDLAPGDAYMDNDPYVGNSHAADHALLVPVFVDGEHLFTAVAKAHQADIGNAVPTTYSVFASDVYAEGALIFPCVQFQSDYEDEEDVIAMCRRRIRVPEQWYGDYLAQLGAARTGERRLQEMVGKYGKETILDFIEEWFDYSERRMDHALRELGTTSVTAHGRHDSFGPFPEIPLTAKLDVDGEEGCAHIDLTGNPPAVEAGLNLTQATATASALCGLFNVLGPDVPHNAGSFRRVDVKLKRGAVVGIPEHPSSCSLATTNCTDRMVNMIQLAFADVGPGLGLAEGGNAMGPGYATVSGIDARNGNRYVNQLVIGNNGGPATPVTDGWLTWTLPVSAGLLYRDSVEIDEQKYPLLFRELRVLTDSAGDGYRRGAPAARVVYGPRNGKMVAIYAADGHTTPPRGARGGTPGSLASAAKLHPDGRREALPTLAEIELVPGEWLEGVECSGGGYGNPREREPELVLADVLSGYVSPERAREVYGVALVESEGTRSVDTEGTRRLREGRDSGPGSNDRLGEQ
jgi:N-methylhydantoinase B